MCDAINEQLGLPLAVTTTSSNLTYFGQRDYWEGFDDPSKTLPWGDTNYLNQRTFCVKGSSGMGNVFVHVIVER